MESDSSSDHDEVSKQRGPMIKSKTKKGKAIITYNKKGVPIGEEAKCSQMGMVSVIAGISKDGRMDAFVKGDEASGAIACRLSTRKDNHIILMPCNPGDHWVLAVLDMQIGSCYYLDSAGHGNVDGDLKRIIEVALSIYGRKSGSNQTSLKWINVECPIQPGITECEYYVLKFMKAIVDEGVEVLTNNFWGKVTYTDAELDMVREEWCSYVTNFVY